MAEYIYKICVSYELNCKIENQKRIWNDKINRELNRQNKEQMKNQAERLTHVDEIKVENLNSAAEKIKCKMKFPDLAKPKNIKQKYYIPRTIGKVNTKKKGGR